MKIIIDQRTLRSAVDKTALFIPNKSTLPQLETMRVCANGKIEFSGTDLESWIHLTVPLAAPVAMDYSVVPHVEIDHGVKTEIEGSVNIPVELFHKAIGAMKEGCQTTLETSEVKAPNGRKYAGLKMLIGTQLVASIAVDETADLPKQPSIGTGARSFLLEATKLRAIVAKLESFVRTDDLYPAQMGIQFAYDGSNIGGTMHVTATNGMMLASLSFPALAGDTRQADHAGLLDHTFSFIVPLPLLRKAVRVLDGIVTIKFTGEHIQFESNGCEVTGKLIDEKYPDWQPLVPREIPYHLATSRDAALSSLTRMMLIATHEGSRITLLMTEPGYMGVAGGRVRDYSSNQLQIAAHDWAGNEGTERLPGAFESTEAGLNIDFNAGLLRDVLQSLECADVTAEFSSNRRAAIFRETTEMGMESIYLLMPLAEEKPRDDMRNTPLAECDNVQPEPEPVETDEEHADAEEDDEEFQRQKRDHETENDITEFVQAQQAAIVEEEVKS
jgi:DNA polymerase III sliding clamp (beta) subunit (PCNA family)